MDDLLRISSFWHLDPSDQSFLGRVILLVVLSRHQKTLLGSVKDQVRQFKHLLAEDGLSFAYLRQMLQQAVYFCAYSRTMEGLCNTIIVTPPNCSSQINNLMADSPTWASLLFGHSARTRKLCDDLHDALNRYQEYLRDENALSESQSVKRLSILASVFLPASLASSILAMTTRFKDLGLVLYDFVGVFVVIASIAITSYVLIPSLVSSMKRQLRQLKMIIHRRTVSPMVWYASYLAIPWAIILASFLVGMFSNLRNGGIILGAGFAISLFAGVIVASMWHRYRSGKSW